ncbi:MAG: NIPSNAP family protein [Bacteroidales bacterium]
MIKIFFALSTSVFLLCSGVITSGPVPVIREYYEIRVYHLTDKSQEDKTDRFLKEVFLPAMHRAGIEKVGVFKPVESDTAFGKRIYVFIPFKTSEQMVQLPSVIALDQKYNEDGKDFLDAPFDNPPFKRYESIYLYAFKDMPVFRPPEFNTPLVARIYELRSYESATEEKALKKIEMFNEGGEMKLFEKLGFNAVFYGQVLAGSTKPNLMYMTSFSNQKSREDHWNEFRNHPEWKELSGLEEYKNTVSKISIFLLHPAAYSDF